MYQPKRTLGVGGDEGGKDSDEDEWGEVSKVNQLQRHQQRVQPLQTEPVGGAEGKEGGGGFVSE